MSQAAALPLPAVSKSLSIETSHAPGDRASLPVLAALIALGIHVWMGLQSEPTAYWAGAVAAGLYALVQAQVPEARLRLSELLTPRGWSQLVFFLQTVLLPTWITIAGPAMGTLPKIPTTASINTSILITAFCYAAYTLGLLWARRSGAGNLDTSQPARRLMNACLVIGLVGLSLRYSSPGEVIASLSDPAALKDLTSDEDGTLRGAAGSFLRPFLLTAVVMFWSRAVTGLKVSAGVKGWWQAASRSFPAILGIVLVGATYNLNRSAFVIPLVAMAAAFSRHVRRVSGGLLASGAALLVVVSLFLGVYRNESVAAADIASDLDTAGSLAEKVDAEALFQIYAMAPQFLGFLLESEAETGGVFKLHTPLASVLSPLPIVGKPWRDDTGTALYNTMIYGSSLIVDQLIPCQGEIFLSFTAVGFFLFYAALGVALAALQKAFDRSTSAFGAYAAHYLSIWLCFLVMGSLGQVSQILIYFCMPLYLYWLFNRELLAAAASLGRGVAR